jgi:septal ring factor EnvC (AmiA/AmiB activator)
MVNPDDLVEFLAHKLEKVLYEVRSSENELTSRIEKIEGMETTDQETNDKVVQVKNNLNSIKTKLYTIGADYSELVMSTSLNHFFFDTPKIYPSFSFFLPQVQVIDRFIKSIIECRGNIKAYFSRKQPIDENSVEGIIEGYELFKDRTMVHFRDLLCQSEEIIEKIKAQEPPCAKEHDTDRVISLLEDLRAYFESETESENSELKKQHQIIEFDKDLKDLKRNIGDLEDQLACRKGDYGENVDTANVTIASFEYFERNVEVSCNL